MLLTAPPRCFSNWNTEQASRGRFGPFLGVWWPGVYSWDAFSGVTGAGERAGGKACLQLAGSTTEVLSYFTVDFRASVARRLLPSFLHGPQNSRSGVASEVPCRRLSGWLKLMQGDASTLDQSIPGHGCTRPDCAGKWERMWGLTHCLFTLGRWGWKS